jgi:hypothetical protein
VPEFVTQMFDLSKAIPHGAELPGRLTVRVTAPVVVPIRDGAVVDVRTHTLCPS